MTAGEGRCLRVIISPIVRSHPKKKNEFCDTRTWHPSVAIERGSRACHPSGSVFSNRSQMTGWRFKCRPDKNHLARVVEPVIISVRFGSNNIGLHSSSATIEEITPHINSVPGSANVSRFKPIHSCTFNYGRPCKPCWFHLARDAE